MHIFQKVFDPSASIPLKLIVTDLAFWDFLALFLLAIFLTFRVPNFCRPNGVTDREHLFSNYPPGTKPIHARKNLGELIFARIHAGRIQENIFEGLFSAY